MKTINIDGVEYIEKIPIKLNKCTKDPIEVIHGYCGKRYIDSCLWKCNIDANYLRDQIRGEYPKILEIECYILDKKCKFKRVGNSDMFISQYNDHYNINELIYSPIYCVTNPKIIKVAKSETEIFESGHAIPGKGFIKEFIIESNNNKIYAIFYAGNPVLVMDLVANKDQKIGPISVMELRKQLNPYIEMLITQSLKLKQDISTNHKKDLLMTIDNIFECIKMTIGAY